MMKVVSTLTRLATLLLMLFLALPAMAERDDDAERKSKNGKGSWTLDGVEVTIEYGRPEVRERTIWGELVPYGDVWRTGADEATTIQLSKDATIEGEPLAAGTYALFTIPGEDSWTIIFNKQAEQWGAYNRDAAQDVLKVTVEPETAEHMEALSFETEGNDVVLRWEKVAVPFSVAAAKM